MAAGRGRRGRRARRDARRAKIASWVWPEAGDRDDRRSREDEDPADDPDDAIVGAGEARRPGRSDDRPGSPPRPPDRRPRSPGRSCAELERAAPADHRREDTKPITTRLAGRRPGEASGLARPAPGSILTSRGRRPRVPGRILAAVAQRGRPATRLRSTSRSSLAGAPLVGLLHHPQVDERFGVPNAVDGPQTLRQEPEQALVVLADGLDEDVVRPGRDDDVVDLGELRDPAATTSGGRPRSGSRSSPSAGSPSFSGSVTPTTWRIPRSTRRFVRARTAASETPRSAAIWVNGRRPSCWRCSMIRLSRSQTSSPARPDVAVRASSRRRGFARLGRGGWRWTARPRRRGRHASGSGDRVLLERPEERVEERDDAWPLRLAVGVRVGRAPVTGPNSMRMFSPTNV